MRPDLRSESKCDLSARLHAGMPGDPRAGQLLMGVVSSIEPAFTDLFVEWYVRYRPERGDLGKYIIMIKKIVDSRDLEKYREASNFLVRVACIASRDMLGDGLDGRRFTRSALLTCSCSYILGRYVAHTVLAWEETRAQEAYRTSVEQEA